MFSDRIQFLKKCRKYHKTHLLNHLLPNVSLHGSWHKIMVGFLFLSLPPSLSLEDGQGLLHFFLENDDKSEALNP